MRTLRCQCFRAGNKTLLIYLYYFQGDKERFQIIVRKEEAVGDALVKFYKSSEISNQVQKEVAAIGESVSII